VLLLSVQYGTGGGMAAALTAIAVSWLTGWPAQAGSEDFYDYARRVWSEPILWLGAAIILGGLRGRQRATLVAVRQQLADAKAQRQSVGALCVMLKSHCEDLERRMACAQDRSIEAGLAVLANLRNSKPADLPRSLSAAVALLFGPAHYAVLLDCDGRLSEREDLSSNAGASRNADVTTRLSPDLEDALIRDQRHLSILHGDDLDLLDGTALFAAPIVSGAPGRVLGAFLVQTLEATHIRPGLGYNLSEMCRELAYALGREQVVVNFTRDRSASRQVQGRSARNPHASWSSRDAEPAPIVEPALLVAPLTAGVRQRNYLRPVAAANAGEID
jgi:hypothetical protein